MPTKTELNALFNAAHKLKQVTEERDALKRSHDEWIEKTKWVQETIQPKELGRHLADILKSRLEELVDEYLSKQFEWADHVDGYNLTIDALRKELADTKLFATDNANWFDALKVDYDKLKAEIAALRNQTPIAYIAWRDGNPCWDEDCVCTDAVWPADGDDDRVSMPVYIAPGAKEKTE